MGDLSSVLPIIFFGSLNILGSAAVIGFNKYVLDAQRFPFVFALVITHCVVSWALAALLFCITPSWFPSLAGPGRISIGWQLIVKGALPIALIFAAQLVLSNMALGLCSIAFLQFMKETSLVLVYLLSVLLNLEVFEQRKGALILAVFAATYLTVKGEIAFSLLGFSLQMVCIVAQAFGIILQGKILTSDDGQKLDPLSYVLIVMPLSALALGLCLAGLSFHGEHSLPSLAQLRFWSPTLLLNAVCAFGHNVVVCFFFKVSSPLTVSMNVILKDIFIVACSSVILHDPISPLQQLGFAGQLAAVGVFSLLKLKPAEFDDGLLKGVYRVLAAPWSTLPITKHDVSSQLLASTDEVGPGSLRQSKKASHRNYQSFLPAPSSK
eukprot:gb/GFBE01082366.1/.p1 GENE.gb/GFBE01082366.1/~~gb/GFBE01082366.1/.p1  ORF type:complete len:380 (+),score=77.78 gb/GFBE01082366.1/:1-1140(+)